MVSEAHACPFWEYMARRTIPDASWKKTRRSRLGRVSAAIEVSFIIACLDCWILDVAFACPPGAADVVFVDVVAKSGTLSWLALFLCRRVNPTPRPTPRATATKKKMRRASLLREANLLRESRSALASWDSDFSKLFSDEVGIASGRERS